MALIYKNKTQENEDKQYKKKREEEKSSYNAAPQSSTATKTTAQKKWYSGSQPTARETYAQMYRAANGDRNKFVEFEQMYNDEQQRIGSPIYNPYSDATNYKPIEALTGYGFDLSGGITPEWLEANRGLLNDKYTTNSSYNAAAPSKSRTPEQNIAGWYQDLVDAEERTQAAESEYSALAEAIAYDVSRGYSDEQILKRVRTDFDKNYKTLAKMDADRLEGGATILNRAVNYSGDDTLYGMIWAARNDGGTGDYFVDAVNYTLGRGNKYTYNKDSEAARDPANYEQYHPYAMGGTYDEYNRRFGVNGFTMADLEKNRAALLDGSEDGQKMYQKAYEAAELTEQAKTELAALQEWADKQVERGKDYADIEAQLKAMIDPSDGNPDGDYAALAKLERARKMGTFAQTSEAIDFTLPSFLANIEAAALQRDAEKEQTEEKKEDDGENIFAAAGKWLGNAAEDVGEWFGNAAGDVGEFFTGKHAEKEEAPKSDPRDSAVYKSIYAQGKPDNPEAVANMQGEPVKQGYGNYDDFAERNARGRVVEPGEWDTESLNGRFNSMYTKGGEWDQQAYLWALNNSTAPEALNAELRDGVMALAFSQKGLDEVSPIARSWWDAHENITNAMTADEAEEIAAVGGGFLGVNMGREISTQDNVNSDAMTELLNLNKEAAGLGAITKEAYAENMLAIGEVSDTGEESMVNQTRLDDIRGALNDAMATYKENETAETVKDQESARGLLQKVNDGVDVDQSEQADFAQKASKIDLSGAAKQDTSYAAAKSALDEMVTTKSTELIADYNMRVAKSGVEAPASQAEQVYANSEIYVQGVVDTAQDIVDGAMRSAAACGMTLDEFNAAYPNLAVGDMDALYARAEEEFRAKNQELAPVFIEMLGLGDLLKATAEEPQAAETVERVAWKDDAIKAFNESVAADVEAASNAGVSLAEYYNKDQERAQQVFDAAGFDDAEAFWKFVQGDKDGKQLQYKVSQYRKEMGLMESVGRGIGTAAIGALKAPMENVSAIFGLKGNDLAAYDMSVRYGGNGKQYLDDLASNFALIENEGERKNWETLIEWARTQPDPFEAMGGMSPRGAKGEADIANLDYAQQKNQMIVAQNGDLNAYNIASSVTGSTLQMGEVWGLSVLFGGAELAANIAVGMANNELFYDLEQEGVDPWLAAFIGYGSGAATGAIENLMNPELKSFAPDMRSAVLHSIRDYGKKAILKMPKEALKVAADAAARFGFDVFVAEPLQEISQDTVEALAEYLGLASVGKADGMPFSQDYLKQEASTYINTVLTTPFLMALGGAWGGFSSRRFNRAWNTSIVDAQGKLDDSYRGAVVNETIDQESRGLSILLAQDELTALQKSKEFAAQNETKAAAADAENAFAEADAAYNQSEEALTAATEAYDGVWKEIRDADTVTDDMRKRRNDYESHYREMYAKRQEVQQRRDEARRAADEANANADAARQAVQEKYDAIISKALDSARKFVREKMFAGMSEETRAAEEAYLAATEELTDAKAEAADLEGIIGKHDETTAAGQEARDAYGRKLNEIDEIQQRVDDLKKTADDLFAKEKESAPAGRPEQVEPQETEAQMRAREAQEAADADQLNARKQQEADMYAAEVAAENAQNEYDAALADISERMKSTDPKVRQQAVEDFRAYTQKAADARTRADMKREVFNNKVRAQQSLASAVDTAKGYRGSDLLEGSRYHDEALEAYNNLNQATADYRVAEAQGAFDAAVEALDPNNAESVNQYLAAMNELGAAETARQAETVRTGEQRSAATTAELANTGNETLVNAVKNADREALTATLNELRNSSPRAADALIRASEIAETGNKVTLTIDEDTGATGAAGLTRAFSDNVDLTDKQEQQFQILDALGKKYGIEFVMHNSLSNVLGAVNGSYKMGGTIHIGLDAIEQGYVQAGLHEMTHWISENNKAGYESLARFVKRELEKQGQDVDALVNERIEQYKRVQNLSPTKALEEIIAESCSMLLTDEENMRRFAEESPEAFTSMHDRFVGFVDSLRSIAAKIAGRQPHGELNALLGKDSSLQRIYDNFTKVAEETSRVKTPYAGVHIDRRTDAELTNKSVEPFFNTHLELYAGWAQNMAEFIRGDIEQSVPAQKIFNFDVGNGQGGTPEVMGIKRQTSDLIARYKDHYNLTWEQLKKGFDTFLEMASTGEPMPNTKIIKIVELMVDDALTNGYTDIDGATSIQPALDYIRAKSEIQGTAFSGWGYLDGSEQMPDGMAYDAAMGYGDSDPMYSANVTDDDVTTIHSIGRKSVNQFTSKDIEKSEKWARKFYRELGTKSPFFRAWFGEWRSNDGKNIVNYTRVSDGFVDVSDIPKGDVTNDDTGWEINVPRRGIDKTANDNGKYSPEYHHLNNITELLKSAVLFDTVVASNPSRKLGKNAAFIHHLYAPIIGESGSKSLAKIYVAEYAGTNVEESKKFYLLREEKISLDSSVSTDGIGFNVNSSSDALTIAQLFDFVKAADEGFSKRSGFNERYEPVEPSKIVNEDGTPKVMYHGTDAYDKFTVFKRGKKGYLGPGMYFSESKAYAQRYADNSGYDNGRVYETYLNVKNPLEVTSDDPAKEILRAATGSDRAYNTRSAKQAWSTQIITNADIKKLQAKGYDGIVWKYGKSPAEVSVFDPEQVKSATDNIGTFSRTNKDINYSLNTQRDEEYSAAVQQGDMETAQRLVDEAANNALSESKIRDEAGNLIPIYHGTKSDFNVFDTTKQGGVNGAQEGFGIYLTDNPAISQQYGSRVIKGYADIKKPASSERRTITRSALSKLIKASCEQEAKNLVNEGYDSINDALKDTWISNYIDAYESPSMSVSYAKAADSIMRMNDNDMSIIQEVMAGMGIRDYESAMEFYNDILIPSTGFDGFATEWTNTVNGVPSKIILAFNSNQIKSADPITYDDAGNVIPLSQRFNPQSEDIRYSLNTQREAEDDIRFVKEAEEHFGKTYRYNEAGYIVLDGQMLDFSGRNQGAPGGYRTVDHRDIQEVRPDNGINGSEAMIDFMAAGNIRVSPESGGINLQVEPNAAQYKRLGDYISHFRGEVIIDIDNANGDTIQSFEYNKGTHYSRVINDLKAYFADGTIPQKQSGIGNFLSLNTPILDEMHERDVDAAINEISEQLLNNGAKAPRIAKALADIYKENAPQQTVPAMPGERNGVQYAVGGDGWKDHRAPTRGMTRSDGDVRNPVQILSDLTNSIRVGYNPGGAMYANKRRLPKKVMGFYNQRARSVTTRTNVASDLATGLHEFGHAVEARLGGIQATQAMIDALPDAVKNSYSAAELNGEAIAEFVVDYMYSRDQAVAAAGDAFVNEFENRLRNDRALDAAILRGRDQVFLWNTASVGEKIDAMISDSSKRKAQDMSNRTWFQRTLDNVEQQLFARDDAAKLVGEKLYNEVRWSNHAKARAGLILKDRLIAPDGTRLGDGLGERFNALQADALDIVMANRYGLARHALDRLDQGKPVFDESEFSRADLENLAAGMEANNPKAVQVADAMVDFWREFRDAWLVGGGLLSEEDAAAMDTMYPHYLPAYRVTDENFGKTDGPGASFTLRAAVEGGSSLEVVNPLHSITKMVNQVVNTVARNRVKQVFNEAMQSGNFGWLAEEVPSDMAVTRVDTSKAEEKLNDVANDVLAMPTNGGTMNALNDIADLNVAIEAMQEQWHDTGRSSAANVVSGIDENGNRFFYRVKDKGLYELLNGISNAAAANRLLNGFNKVKNGMTRLTTGSNPLFAVKNAMRDFQQSVNTGTWGVTYVDGIVKWVRAFAEVASNSNLFKEWQDMGGGNNTLYRTDDQRDVNTLMDDIAPEKGVKATLRRAGKGFLNAITLERLNEIVENTSRFAEYRFGKHDLSTFEGRQEAFIASQDVTVDFSEHGAGNIATVMNRLVPFANATMQGLNKDINLVRDLIGTRSTKEQRVRAAETLGKTVLNTGLLAALQWALVDGLFGGDDDDDEEYGLLSDEMKAGNLVFKLPKALTDKLGFDRPWVRIPIAQGVIQRSLWASALNITGDVANMDEMTLDMRKMANSILWDALPSGSIISGWIDATNNKTYYGGQIVSDSALKRSAPNQYNADTIDAFKNVSRWLYDLGIEISPAVMQYMFEQYSGIIGKIAIPALSGNKYTGEWTPLDSLKNVGYSIAKNYTIDPVTSTDITNNYKDAKTMLTQISYDAKNGDPVNDLPLVLSESEMDDAIKDAQSAMKKGGFIYETDKQVSALWDEISDIQNSDEYSDGEKALKIRELRREMDYVEQEGLAEYAEYLMQYGIKDSILKQIMSVIKPK